MLTVQQQCAARDWEPKDVALADHLSRVSLTNKINFARLHGLTLEVIANPVSIGKVQWLLPCCVGVLRS